MIFVLQRAEGNNPPSVVVATEGVVTVDENGLQWLTLMDGSRYEGNFSGKQFQISDFREYGLVIRQQEMERSNRKAAAKPTMELFGTQDNAMMAELQWRLSLPLSIPVLTLLVVPAGLIVAGVLLSRYPWRSVDGYIGHSPWVQLPAMIAVGVLCAAALPSRRGKDTAATDPP